jgi:subtilisin
MQKLTPAWSSQFALEKVSPVPMVYPLDHLSWEQACGEGQGQGVKVAIIDSGVDATHPALLGPVNGYTTVIIEGETIRYEQGPHEDSCGHGTACAGIIRSLAPACEIYSVKVLGKGLIGRGSAFIAGVRWAIENNMDICNLSLGTTKREFFAGLHEVVDQAYFHHIPLVTAANNMPIPSFPSMYSSVISVAAHHEADPLRFYYNPHPPMEFGARGIDVPVPWLYQTWSTVTGNSFAAPHITGICTRILAEHPHLPLFQLKTMLRALAANISTP